MSPVRKLSAAESGITVEKSCSVTDDTLSVTLRVRSERDDRSIVTLEDDVPVNGRLTGVVDQKRGETNESDEDDQRSAPTEPLASTADLDPLAHAPAPNTIDCIQPLSPPNRIGIVAQPRCGSGLLFGSEIRQS